jgi:serine/threonine protein kinase
VSNPNQPADRISFPNIGLGGTVLGKWRLGRFLGEGEFGAVYEGAHTVIDGLRSAVKVLHPHKALDPATIRRFINEASAASHANHENIIRIYDGDAQPGGTCYLAMELLTGTTLRQRLKAGPLDLQKTIHIAIQIAEALEAAHRLNIIHRDLKPDNVHLGERPNRPDFVTLFDFGIARLRDAAEEGSHLRTRSGVIMGTPEYMSPEQWRGAADIDARADVYALGILLYECVSGKPPFSGNLYEVMRAHVENPVPALSGTTLEMQTLSVLIVSMLAKERTDRPANMRVVVETLQKIAQGGALSMRISGSMPVAPPPVSAPEERTLIEAQAPQALVDLWRNSGSQPVAPPPREPTGSQPLREPTSGQSIWRPSGSQAVVPPPEGAQALGGTTLPGGTHYAPTMTSEPESGWTNRRVLAMVAGGVVAVLVLVVILWPSSPPEVNLPDPPEEVEPPVVVEKPAPKAVTRPAPAPSPPPSNVQAVAPTPTEEVDEEDPDPPPPTAPNTGGRTGEGTVRSPISPGKITMTGANPAQKRIIEGCLKLTRLPAQFEMTLERAGALYITNGPRPPAVKECLRMNFSTQTAPEKVIIRRR